MNIKLFLLASLSVLVAVPAFSAGFRSPYVLLCLSAHPDDEDGATLAYYHDKFGMTTYSVFFTRGEGGQNETGPELYKDLAVIRTRETENASHIVGSQAMFLNLHDFGYSKSAPETYKMWGGRDEVLRRLVYVIRRLKPDVIITNHHPSLDGGENHGNHQVAAMAALEAMDAAADSTYHPEQFREKGVAPWSVHKLFMRVWDYKDSTNPEASATGYSSAPESFVPVGDMDVLTGKRYQELANSALREHHSQGMEFFQSQVKPTAKIWYKLMQADANYPSIRDNLFAEIIPSDDRDTAMVAASTLPAEFTSLDYLDAVQPKLYPPTSPAVRKDLRVGVIRSYDNTIGDALSTLHVSHTMLDSAMITSGDLGKFQTILVDIRAYSKRQDLVHAYKRLVEYVVKGGNLVVFYQKTMEWKPEYAPFPLTITRKRVTDEDSPLAVMIPNEPLFLRPNTIDSVDWTGWIIERGLYFPEESKDYQDLLAVMDPAEPLLTTGLLKARFGNGTYWYCALSLYRQLRQNNPGALKLFANLISYETK